MTREVRKGRHRLSIDIPSIMHQELKRQAITYNCTITKYVLKALVEKMKRERNEREEDMPEVLE
jgi:hypothetical protein